MNPDLRDSLIKGCSLALLLAAGLGFGRLYASRAKGKSGNRRQPALKGRPPLPTQRSHEPYVSFETDRKDVPGGVFNVVPLKEAE
ncbi:hypothetical protein [Pseudomonas mangiferae]|uniref:Uncharacterized protein n=1 Tax=Pseudomonas mangiferae TaxID=2593654 RepID=A0A553H4L3_9PSED|nr:hypothetical protein [Pseudomonas mangiferae]TRX76695.1 hypothetical protein FM069_01350 [Pseudomonas mangiferae]